MTKENTHTPTPTRKLRFRIFRLFACDPSVATWPLFSLLASVLRSFSTCHPAKSRSQGLPVISATLIKSQPSVKCGSPAVGPARPLLVVVYTWRCPALHPTLPFRPTNTRLQRILTTGTRSSIYCPARLDHISELLLGSGVGSLEIEVPCVVQNPFRQSTGRLPCISNSGHTFLYYCHPGHQFGDQFGDQTGLMPAVPPFRPG